MSDAGVAVVNRTQNSSHCEWLDLRALTAYACVSERTIRTWIHSSENPLPAVQVGKKILIRRGDFDEWLERYRLKPASSLDLGGMVDQLLAGVSGRK